MKNTRTISKDTLVSRLKNMSIHYLQRYPSTSNNLDKYLRKKVKEYNKEALQENPEIMNMFNQAIAEVIEFLEKLGYLNDKIYSKNQLRNLLNKGKSTIAINYKLQEKGVSKEDIRETLISKDKTGMELYAALKFLRRKSFGAYRKPLDDEELLQKKIEKEYASIARQGFNYDTIKKVLNMEKTEVEDLIFNLERELDL
ncbi:MAG: recombination regulator RecX [Alphaproteobacteria bacterium]|jgi:SOS response regulatory protein OraA/RecX|nr:recombination regulator RecX [Alphaproteobacteria bacterium]